MNHEAQYTKAQQEPTKENDQGNKVDKREMEILDIFQDAINWDESGQLADAIRETIERFLEYTDELSEKEKRWAYNNLNIKMIADLA